MCEQLLDSLSAERGGQQNEIRVNDLIGERPLPFQFLRCDETIIIQLFDKSVHQFRLRGVSGAHRRRIHLHQQSRRGSSYHLAGT
jgi:hypothetical protein